MDWASLLTAMMPSVLQGLEVLFSRRAGQPPTGMTKLGAAVNIGQTILMTAAASGRISPNAASDIGAIVNHIDGIVRGMKGNGQLGGQSQEVTSQAAPLQPGEDLPSATKALADLVKKNIQ